jgi:hypothetical protein
MATPGKNLDDLLKMTPDKAKPDSKPDDGDVGPCAARVKDRWVTALTIKHHKKAWDSFQYNGIGTHSTFTPEKFEVVFVAHDRKWRVAVEGRSLWTIYNSIIQHRLEWIEEAIRDFAGDSEPLIKKVEVVEIEEKD